MFQVTVTFAQGDFTSTCTHAVHFKARSSTVSADLMQSLSCIRM